MKDASGATVPAFASTVGQVLSRSAARRPDAQALRFEQRTWTYAELDRAAGRVAAALLARGLNAGDRVAAFGANSDAYLLLYLGCAKAGLVHVPINFNARRDELRYLLAQSEPRIAFVDPSLAEHVETVAGRLHGITLGSLRDSDNDADVSRWATDPAGPVHEEHGVRDSDLVQLLYTSGTTSQAKGAMLTHRALVHEYVSAAFAFELSDRDTALHPLPLYHAAQLQAFLMPMLTVGAANHLIAAPALDELFERVPNDGIDSLFLPPTVWVGVANDPRLDSFSGLRKAFYGASIMPLPVLERLRQRLPGVRFFNAFGQSEIGPVSTVLRPEEHAERPGSIGRSVLFVQTRVVDPEMNDVAPGEVGEVVYRSPQLCEGYWGKPKETEEAFRGGWFHSGDLCRIDAEGYLFVVDRIKDVINTGGVLVASREVEDALYAHDAVAEVAVIGIPHERWIEAITAVVVPAQEVSADALIAFCRERLASHKIPKSVHFIDELPKNASGKLLKRELRARLSGSASAVGGVAVGGGGVDGESVRNVRTGSP